MFAKWLLFLSLFLLLLLLLLCTNHSLTSQVSLCLSKRQTEQEYSKFAALFLPSDNKTDLTLSVLLSKHNRCAATAITMKTENMAAARIKEKILTVASDSSVAKIIAFF